MQLYGLEQAKRQMGWTSFALGGMMYILGTFIYAVSPRSRPILRIRALTIYSRSGSLSVFILAAMMFGAVHIKSFTSPRCWALAVT